MSEKHTQHPSAVVFAKLLYLPVCRVRNKHKGEKARWIPVQNDHLLIKYRGEEKKQYRIQGQAVGFPPKLGLQGSQPVQTWDIPSRQILS